MVVRNELTDDEVDRIFQALADSTRRDIVVRVLRQEQSVSALAAHYRMSFAAVQTHVTKERRGREQVVHAGVATLRRAAALLADYEQIWRGRARAIEDLLAEETPPGDPGPRRKGA